jgi:GTP pyrophosphokinase
MDFETSIGNIRLAPYIVKATALIGVRQKGGGNMFRHQFATLAILLDYKIVDPVLLKASLIHDLFEDAAGMPGVTREGICGIDPDGPAVFDLVMELTQRTVGRVPEPKSEYLLRVMQYGSDRAKVLKLADRISNLTALGYVHQPEFTNRTVRDTKLYILPYAKNVNEDMFRELSDLVASREAIGPARVHETLTTTRSSAPSSESVADNNNS